MESGPINETSARGSQQAFRADGRQHDGLSFLDLSAEIRIVVYRFCLLRHHREIIFNGKSPSTLIAGIPLANGRAGVIVSTLPKLRPFGPTGSLRSHSGANTITVSLLRLSKQIHHEAAAVLYSEYKFEFALTEVPYTTYVLAKYGRMRQDVVAIEDNLTKLAPVYMRMIKQCELVVRVYMPSLQRRSSVFAKHKARIASFADAFGGNDHSLQTLHISFAEVFRNEQERNIHRPMCGHILEPLATIYGIRRSVLVEGLGPALSADVRSAMVSRVLAVTPKEERYKTRLVKTKGSRGRKVPQRYRQEPYYVTRYIWLEPSAKRNGMDIA